MSIPKNEDIKDYLIELIDEAKENNNYTKIIKFIELIDDNIKEENIKSIKLSEDMTIGIEIESEGYYSKQIYLFSDLIEKGWKCKGESTIANDGVEVISPILGKNLEDETKQIEKVCRILKRFGQDISTTCAAHVHVGAHSLKSLQAWKNLAEIWGNTELIWYAISCKEGEIPNLDRIKYIKPISGNLEQILDDRQNVPSNEKDFKDMLKSAQGYKEDNVTLNEKRYYGINFLNVDETKNTIEFRIPNGTLDANTWIEDINLFGGLVKISQELAVIQAKPFSERNSKEQNLLENLQLLKKANIEEPTKLQALLTLVVPEEDREIYKKRYNTNIKLLNENLEIKDELMKNIAQRQLDFSSRSNDEDFER